MVTILGHFEKLIQMKISSTQNPSVKQLKKYTENARARNKDKVMLLDGFHLLEEYLTQFDDRDVQIFYTKNAENTPDFQKLKLDRIKRHCVETHVMNFISPAKTPAGIVSLVPLPQKKEAEYEALKNILVLESIQDPGNLGTIIRTASAAGFEDIFLSADCTDPYSPKCLRSGMGAQFRLNIYQDQDLGAVIKNFEDQGGKIYGTSLQAEKSLYDLTFSEKTGFVFGNEGQGLSKNIEEALTHKIIIPMHNDTESLNVAMATTVVCFEWRRQNQSA